jgi:hypothetical protein
MLKTIAYRRVLLAFATGSLLAAGLATAQETPKAGILQTEAQKKPASVYRLDYVVREIEDGKRINSRNYSLSAKSAEMGLPNAERASLRIGSRVPIEKTAIHGNGATVSSGTVEYQDVGINIDSQLHERDNDILLNTSFSSSSIVTPEKPTEEHGSPISLPPVFRRVQFTGDSLVTPGKPTVIATLDDVTSNRRYEIEVTATKVK